MISDLYLASIKEIDSKHELKTFDCGIKPLNQFLVNYAKKNDSLGIGKTFVALDKKGNIAGYFTLATAQVTFDELPENQRGKLPKYPVPSIRIARLAVAKSYQNSGVGKWLLTQIFYKILHVADLIGLYLIIVDAKESSRAFYEKYGFQQFSNEELTYFLPVETVRMALRNSSASETVSSGF